MASPHLPVLQRDGGHGPAHAGYTGYKTIGWIIHNLIDLDPRCASAKYILLASGTNTYKPDAFDAASETPKPALTS